MTAISSLVTPQYVNLCSMENESYEIRNGNWSPLSSQVTIAEYIPVSGVVRDLLAHRAEVRGILKKTVRFGQNKLKFKLLFNLEMCF